MEVLVTRSPTPCSHAGTLPCCMEAFTIPFTHTAPHSSQLLLWVGKCMCLTHMMCLPPFQWSCPHSQAVEDEQYPPSLGKQGLKLYSHVPQHPAHLHPTQYPKKIKINLRACPASWSQYIWNRFMIIMEGTTSWIIPERTVSAGQRFPCTRSEEAKRTTPPPKVRLASMEKETVEQLKLMTYL